MSDLLNVLITKKIVNENNRTQEMELCRQIQMLHPPTAGMTIYSNATKGSFTVDIEKVSYNEANGLYVAQAYETRTEIWEKWVKAMLEDGWQTRKS